MKSGWKRAVGYLNATDNKVVFEHCMAMEKFSNNLVGVTTPNVDEVEFVDRSPKEFIEIRKFGISDGGIGEAAIDFLNDGDD